MTASSTSATAPTSRLRPRRFSVSTSCCCFSHAITSPTVRKEPNTTILSSVAGQRFRRGEGCRTANRTAVPRQSGEMRRDFRGQRAARARQRSEMPARDARRELAQHARRCPCRAACRTRRSSRARSPTSARFCAEHLRRLRVVRDVEDHLRAARQHLEARRAASTSASPRRTSCMATGSSSVPSAQIAAAALRSCMRAAQRGMREPAAPAARAPVRPLRLPALRSRNPFREEACRRRRPSTERGGSGSAITAGRPARKMPAFSRPIDFAVAARDSRRGRCRRSSARRSRHRRRSPRRAGRRGRPPGSPPRSSRA